MERMIDTSVTIAWRVPVFKELCIGTVMVWLGGPWCRSLTWLPFWRITTYPTASSALISRSADTPRGNFMPLPAVSTRPSHNASGPSEDESWHRQSEVIPLQED